MCACVCVCLYVDQVIEPGALHSLEITLPTEIHPWPGSFETGGGMKLTELWSFNQKSELRHIFYVVVLYFPVGPSSDF